MAEGSALGAMGEPGRRQGDLCFREHPSKRLRGFNISGNRYRLIAKIGYAAGIVDIRFFGSHTEYNAVDAETA
jgi:hypothetical protein